MDYTSDLPTIINFYASWPLTKVSVYLSNLIFIYRTQHFTVSWIRTLRNIVVMLWLTEILQNIICQKLCYRRVQKIPQVANDILTAVSICIRGSFLIWMLWEIRQGRVACRYEGTQHLLQTDNSVWQNISIYFTNIKTWKETLHVLSQVPNKVFCIKIWLCNVRQLLPTRWATTQDHSTNMPHILSNKVTFNWYIIWHATNGKHKSFCLHFNSNLLCL